MKERFDDILSKKLSDAEITPPLDGFMALEGQLMPMLERKKRRLVLYRYASVAAAACLLCALLVGQLMNVSAPDPADLYSVDLTNQDVQETELTEIIEDAVSIRTVSSEQMLAKISRVLSADEGQDTVPQQQTKMSDMLKYTEPKLELLTQAFNSSDENSAKAENTASDRARTFDNDNSAYIPSFAKTKGKSSFVLDAYVGALGSASNQVSLGKYGINEIVTTKSEVVNEVVDNYKHKFPLTVGVNVGWRIGDSPFTIETGLNYSYLESTANMQATYNYHLTQRLHYLGIPLRVNYSFARPLDKFDFYVAAGGSIDVALKGSVATDIYNGGVLTSSKSQDIHPRGLMYSVSMQVGAAYHFMPRLGLFVEPGVNYYFNNASHPTSYRTDGNLKFDLRVGLRTRF